MFYSIGFVFTIFLMLFFNNNTFAQQGCADSDPDISNPTVYITKVGISTIPRYYYFGTGLNKNTLRQPQPQCNNFYRTIISSGAYRSCRVNWISSTSTTTNSYFDGWLVTYELNCTLDDYMPTLLLATGGLGFIILRKKNAFSSI